MRSCQRRPTAAAPGRSRSAPGRVERAPGRFRERVAVSKPESEKGSGPHRSLRGRGPGVSCVPRQPGRTRLDEAAELLIRAFTLDIFSATAHSRVNPNHISHMKITSKILAGSIM